MNLERCRISKYLKTLTIGVDIQNLTRYFLDKKIQDL